MSSPQGLLRPVLPKTRGQFSMRRNFSLGEAGAAFALTVVLFGDKDVHTILGLSVISVLLAGAFGLLCVAGMYELHWLIPDGQRLFRESEELERLRSRCADGATVLALAAAFVWHFCYPCFVHHAPGFFGTSSHVSEPAYYFRWSYGCHNFLLSLS
ncbi:MAG: hypothetical protein ACYDHM_15690 [Acidiferrobacterales bacterium]